ncbi:MAG TPA: PspC domain-containing protein [Verrucomicrobiae bacterium]|jgi:phage shock protein PspC (stress-responsive transcriptional regulator)|nr:PspC domain-containing protein [Verrucomicrobiae bacterium]
MKNIKLLIAFVAGFAISRLIKIGPEWPSFNLPSEETSLLGTIALMTIVLVGAFLSSRRETAEPGSTNLSAFFQSLRQLHASDRDSFLGGVCGGLGEATRAPSYVWRLLFAVTFFFFGVGLWTYILLWIFLPTGETQPAPKSESKDVFDFLHRLKRNKTDSWIGGVCGGLAKVTPAPSWVWRLGFVMLAFSYGSGLIIYLLLCFFVPLEDAPDHFST